MSRECISLNLGQAGCQLGGTTWELFCLEHGIQPDGTFQNNEKERGEKRTHDPHAFFQELGSGKMVPRALFVDLDPSVIDEIRKGSHGKLFHPNDLISGKEDAANNFARGRFVIGREKIDEVIERVRKLAENCDAVQSFNLFQSVGGGTGGGFGSLLLEKLDAEYHKITKFDFTIMPSPNLSNSAVEPYNALLSTHFNMEHSHISFLFDNEALFNICKKNLGIERPSYLNLNRIISQCVSSMTSSIRFPGELNVDISEFRTNLIPFPRIRFPLVSFAPIVSREKAFHESASVSDITSACFETGNTMVKCNPSMGKYIACCLLYRGDVAPKDVSNVIQTIKKKKTIQFVDWSPAGFKVGLNNSAAHTLKVGDLAPSSRSVCLLANNTSVIDVFSRINHKFDLLYSKRAFVHWFVGEGMEEGEFHEAREDLAALEKDYEEIAKDSQEEEF